MTSTQLDLDATQFDLDMLAEYGAELLGTDWHSRTEAGQPVVRHIDGFTVAIEAPSGDDDTHILDGFQYGADGVGEFDPDALGVGVEPIVLTGCAEGADDWDHMTLRPRPQDSLRIVGAEFAGAVRELYAMLGAH